MIGRLNGTTAAPPAPPAPAPPSPADRIRALAQSVQMRATQQPALSPILAELVGMLTYSVSELNQLRQEVLMLAVSLDAPSPEVASPEAPKSGAAEPAAAAGNEAEATDAVT